MSQLDPPPAAWSPPPPPAPVTAPPAPLVPLPPPGVVDITADGIDTYYYAVSHRPVMRALTIKNIDIDPGAGDVTVRIQVEGPTEQPLLHDHSFEFPALSVGDEKTFRAIRIAPNHRELALLDEQVSANLTTTVSVGGQVVGVDRRPITFLAYNQWMHRPEFYDSFSSFVLPNHPVVGAIMARARVLLGERTGKASTEGYQSDDPGRVREIARALFDALAEGRLNYANPPASFEGFGQKIRTPDLVVQDHCGTCLDTSVLYASCLAAAGLDPLLVLTRGHAFAGYWTRAAALEPDLTELASRPVLDNPNDIAALFAAGALQPVETTLFTLDEHPRTFDQAAQHDTTFFTDRSSELEALVNVGAARAAGVRPIPSRRIVNGVLEIEHEAPTTPAAAIRDSPAAVAANGTDLDTPRLGAFEAPPRVRAWLNSLLDLSFANPLIDMKPGRHAFRLDLPPGVLAQLENRVMAPDQAIELVPASRVPARILDEASLADALAADFATSGTLYFPDIATLEPQIDSAKRKAIEHDPALPPARAQRAAEETVAATMTQQLESSVASLKRKAREIESQSGSNNLFLSIGSLKWTEPPVAGTRKREGMATAPLFLIPVRISGSASTSFRISADEGVEVTPNYCLLEKLRLTFGLIIPELETPDLDEAGIDVNKTLAAVRKALGEKRLDDVVVEETAHIAVLNFATFRLWKDMRDHWQQFLANPVVRHLVERPHEEFENVDTGCSATSDELLCPIEIDESQLEAVRWAVEGRSFVIEGPPGTGKSQTITNLLAASIAASKRVLFVAEKQPALQVVKKRLEQIGLTPFCIDLHDKGSKPEQIRKQVRDALDFAGVDREAEWAELSARLLSDEQALAAYREVIHGVNAAGYSAWSARQELADIGPGDAAEVPGAFMVSAAKLLPSVRESLLALPAVAAAARIEPGGAWSLCDRIDFGGIDQATLADLVTRMQAILDALSTLPAAPKQALARIAGPDRFAGVLDTIDRAFTTGLPTDAEMAAVGSPAWNALRDQALQHLNACDASVAALLGVFSDSAFAADLAPIIAAGSEAATAGLLSRGKKERAFQLLLAPLVRDKGQREPAELVGLLQQIAPVRADIDAVEALLRSVPAMRLPVGWTVLKPADVASARVQLEALPREAAQLGRGEAAAVRSALQAGWVPDAATMTAIRQAEQMWLQLSEALAVSSDSLARWRNGRGFFEAWAASNPAWIASAPRFLGLQRWCEVVGCVRPIATAGLSKLAADLLTGSTDLEAGYDNFRRGFVRAALHERLEAGRVDQFDGLAHGRRVRSFIERSAQQRSLMRTVIPHHLVKDRPFRPGARFGDYGALERELSKSARRLSIRKLVEHYGQILPTLTPCFLMSPDSVARFLPPGSMEFDLVVFDEASQIEVAEAIGAMGRAKAVVVVGDSKQMPPSKFGGIVVDSEAAADAGADGAANDDLLVEDLESILSECVESNLPRLYLQCHYRSRHEALIAFSNAAFYEGKLTTFPSPRTDGPAPIHWRRIDGHFVRTGGGDEFRTNRAEAEAIVDEIVRRVNDPQTSAQSLCVVTLNVQQQALVQRLLEARGDDRIKALLDDETDAGLIVRNLESVQGDERDVVLISVAFSPIERTAVDGATTRRLPLNFGPLNRKGGERRLNVAVTRARQQVVVFCSFEPEEMRLAENPAKGLEMLKQYLSIARDGSRTSGDLVAREPTAPDHHRADIATALRERGLRVRENVGLSKFRIDLAVGRADGADWQVAVLLDGPGWASRTTVYDREALPPNVLAMMGWPRVVRVWLPSWIQERERVVEEIAFAVEASIAETPAEVLPAESVRDLPPPPAGPVEPDDAAPLSDHEMTFVEAEVSSLGTKDVLDRLDEPAARALVERAIDEALAAESPIHAVRLAKLVATRFGFDQVRQNRINEILELATRSHTRRSEFGVFLWKPDADPQAWTRYRRTPPGVERKLEHIAPEEISNAMVDVAGMSHTIDPAELIKVTAEIFGSKKLSAAARRQLTDVIAWSVAAGRLVEEDGRLRIP